MQMINLSTGGPFIDHNLIDITISSYLSVSLNRLIAHSYLVNAQSFITIFNAVYIEIEGRL